VELYLGLLESQKGQPMSKEYYTGMEGIEFWTGAGGKP
jgi:hypothetical protein